MPSVFTKLFCLIIRNQRPSWFFLVYATLKRQMYSFFFKMTASLSFIPTAPHKTYLDFVLSLKSTL